MVLSWPRGGRSVAGLSLVAVLSGGLWAPTVVASAPVSGVYLDAQAPITTPAATITALDWPAGAAVRVTAPNLFFEFYFRAANSDTLVPGTYAGTTNDGNPAHPYIQSGAHCLSPTADFFFVIHEISRDLDAKLTSLAVDYRITCDSGTFHGAIRFASDWPVGAVSTSLNHVNLEQVSTAEAARERVTVTSSGTAGVEVTALRFVGDGDGAEGWSTEHSTCNGVTLTPGATCTFDVVFRPSTWGERRARLEIDTDGFASRSRAASVEAYGLIATTTSISTSPAAVVTGEPFSFIASVSPASAGRFQLYVDDVAVAYVDAFPSGEASFWVNGLPYGPHSLRAAFIDPSDRYAPSSRTEIIRATHKTTTTISASKASLYEGAAVTLTAKVSGPMRLAGGTLVIDDDTTGKRLASMPVTVTKRSMTITTKPAAGGHGFIARYLGSTTYGPSESGVYVNVLPDDGVALVKVTASPTTVYPYKDDYRDTAQIGGVLDEPATVKIQIYNAAGSRVFLKDLGTKTGTYATTWNGRNSSGSVLASGKYRVVQSFADQTGHTKSTTQYLTVSQKRMYTYTTYVTKAGSAVSTKTGKVTISTSGGYARLTGSYPDLTFVGYQFTLPSATLYKSIAFQAYAKGPRSVPPNQIAMQNFSSCPSLSGAWNVGCFDRAELFGAYSATWFSTSGSITHNRTDRTVRGLVNMNVGTSHIYKVRVKVVYGILK